MHSIFLAYIEDPLMTTILILFLIYFTFWNFCICEGTCAVENLIKRIIIFLILTNKTYVVAVERARNDLQ